MPKLNVRLSWRSLIAFSLLGASLASVAQPRDLDFTTLRTDPFKLPPKTIYSKTHVVVAFHPTARESVKKSVMGRLALSEDTKMSSRYFSVLHLSPDAIKMGQTVEQVVRQLNSNPAVRYAEFDTLLEPDYVPNDARFSEMWALNNTGQTGGTADADIDAVQAWDVTGVHAQEVVAVCDDGVDLAHPDLDGNIWNNSDEIAGNGIDDDGNGFVDDFRGWDFADGDNNPSPAGTDSHGTHVAGTIGAEINNGIGVAGVGRNLRIMPLRIYGGANPWMSALANAVDYARQNGASVISVSYNIDGYTTALVDAIQRAKADDVIYCNSAGNNNQANPPRQAIRSVADNVVFIAASDHNDQKSSFSNYGTLVEVFLPGEDILSTLPGNTYGLNSGTSMATPHASGMLGVIRAMYPTATARQALDRLIALGDSVPALSSYVANGKRANLLNAMDNDTVAPGAITGLTAERRAFTVLELSMTIPGDDGMVGPVDGFDVRVSPTPITDANFAAARPVLASVPSAAPGTSVRFRVNGIWPGDASYVAVRAKDNVGNVSPTAFFGPLATRSGAWGDRVESTNQFTGDATWATTTAQQYSGSRSWTDSPAGNYGNNASTSLVMNTPVVVNGPVAFKFQAKVDLESNYDFLYIEVQKNGGAWQTLTRLTGARDWTQYGATLDAMNGDSMRVRFRMTSDGSVVRDGVYLDDFVMVPVTPVFSDSFEGTNNFSAQTPWAKVADAFSPVTAWADSPGGSYGANANTALTGTNTIDLRGIADPALLMQAKYDLETNYDYLNIEQSADGGSTWTRASALNGTQTAWGSVSLNLLNQEFTRVRFRLTSDGTAQRDGVTMDDVRIVGEPWEDKKVATGTVGLDRFVWTTASLPATLEILHPTTNAVLESHPLPLTNTGISTQGTFSFGTFLDGTVNLRIKVKGYLSNRITGVNLVNGLSGLNVVLKIGDVNGDNKVDGADLDLIKTSFGLLPSDPRFNPNADVNGDGQVNNLDLRWTRLNVGLQGN